MILKTQNKIKKILKDNGIDTRSLSVRVDANSLKVRIGTYSVDAEKVREIIFGKALRYVILVF